MPQYFPIAISYAQGGLVNDKAAFNLTEDSFQLLENAFNFRGRILRRSGYESLARLQRNLTVQPLGNTDGAGNFSGNIFVILGINVTQPNAQIVPGSITITVGAQTFIEAATPDGTLIGSLGGSGTINYTTGDLTLTGAAAVTPVTITFSYYPLLPVMGLRPYETSTINDEQLVAFDTIFAYRFNNLTFQFEQLGTATWSGTDADFFWTTNVLVPNSTNYLLFATNFNVGPPGDPIRYFDGTNWITPFNPALDNPVTTRLQQARILVQYRGRLVALNTYEGANLVGSVQFPQRARWSQLGDPTDLVNAWRSDIAGRGSFIDCPTSESIVSAEFVRDTLIVGFERSTWKLRYTGIELTPFVWERINRELGCESTFSTIPFDKGILSIGDKSINVCTGNGVDTIDQNIPDEVFNIHNGNSGVFRVYGVRDFFNRYAYWTFPDADTNPTFPDRLLAYDYQSGAWAIFTDSFTCFGPFQGPSDTRWSDLTRVKWQDADFPWNSSQLQSKFPNVAAGNQQGYVFIFNPRTGDGQQVDNDPSLQITAISSLGGTTVQITSPNHNMQDGEFVRLSGIIGDDAGLNDQTYKISDVTTNTFTIQSSVTIGAYLGLGQIERVFNMRVRSKKFNLMEGGSQGYFGHIDFLALATDDGEVTCEIRVNNNDSTPINPVTDTFYNNVFTTQRNFTFNQDGDVLWQRFYCPTTAQFFDFTLTFSDDQMLNPDIIDSAVRIEAFIVWTSKGGRLVK